MEYSSTLNDILDTGGVGKDFEDVLGWSTLVHRTGWRTRVSSEMVVVVVLCRAASVNEWSYEGNAMGCATRYSNAPRGRRRRGRDVAGEGQMMGRITVADAIDLWLVLLINFMSLATPSLPRYNTASRRESRPQGYSVIELDNEHIAAVKQSRSTSKMLAATRRWFRRNRTPLTIGLGVLGAGYVATQYVLTKFAEARERSSSEHVSREKYCTPHSAHSILPH